MPYSAEWLLVEKMTAVRHRAVVEYKVSPVEHKVDVEKDNLCAAWSDCRESIRSTIQSLGREDFRCRAQFCYRRGICRVAKSAFQGDIRCIARVALLTIYVVQYRFIVEEGSTVQHGVAVEKIFALQHTVIVEKISAVQHRVIVLTVYIVQHRVVVDEVSAERRRLTV